jgi:hypothetical protein
MAALRRGLKETFVQIVRFIAAVSLALAALATAGAPAALAAPVPLTEGSADWGFKQSFRSYAGGGTLAGGATVNQDGTYRFPLTSGSRDAEAGTMTAQFGGSVHYVAHCEYDPCALDMTLANPRVEVTPTGATLYVDVKSYDYFGTRESVDAPNTAFATLDAAAIEPIVTAGVTVWPDVPAILTAEGAAAFAGFYAAGTVLDPLTFTDGPPAVETWTAPGTPRYTRAAATPLPSADSMKRIFADPEHDELWAVAGKHVLVLDADTLAIKDSIEVTNQSVWDLSFAYDAEHRTAFVRASTALAPDGAVAAITWDGTDLSSTLLPGTYTNASSGFTTMAYDPAAERLYVSMTQQTVTWTRDGSGGWARVDFGPGTCGSTSGYFDGIWPLSDGTVIAKNTAQMHVLTWSAEALTCTPITGTNATSITGRGSYHVLERGPGDVRIVREAAAGEGTKTSVTKMTRVGGTWTVDLLDRPRMEGAVANFWTSVDPADGAMFVGLKFGGTRFWVNRIVDDGTPQVFDMTTFKPGLLAAVTALDGAIYTTEADESGSVAAVYRWVGVSPSVTEQPADATATIAPGETGDEIELEAAFGGTPTPTLQWQTKGPGARRWTNVTDATGTALTAGVSADDDGRRYRVVASNAAGELASDPATVTVRTAPGFATQPDDVSVIEGQDARIELFATGNPDPDVQWQRQVDGFWVDVNDGSGDFLIDRSGITIKNANVAMSGAKFRARLSNVVASDVRTRVVKLTVTALPSQSVTFGSGTLDWGVRESFRNYIVGPIAHGSVAVSGAATQNLDGTFRFEVLGGEYDAATGVGEIRLAGGVAFKGHDTGSGPQLNLSISKLRVVLAGGTGTLHADVASQSLADGQLKQYPGVALAALTLPPSGPAAVAGGLAFAPIAAALTEAGAPAFAAFYPAGSGLDPLALTALYGTPREGDGDGTVPPPAGDGGTLPPPPGTVVPPPPGGQPQAPPQAKPAPKPTWSVPQRTLLVQPGRDVVIATITCRNEPCTVAVPKRVNVKIAGKVYRADVLVPKRIGAGRSAKLRVKLPKAARAALAGRRAQVNVKVSVGSGGRKTTRMVRVTVRAKQE